MTAERGVEVDPSTIWRWVQRYAPQLEEEIRWRAIPTRPGAWMRPASGSTSRLVAGARERPAEAQRRCMGLSGPAAAITVTAGRVGYQQRRKKGGRLATM